MSSKRFVIIIIVLLILAAIAISIIMTVDEDIGDFNIKYVGNSKKYETFIKQGVNRWSSIGVGGVYVEFRVDNLSKGIVASTLGNTVTISETAFNNISSVLKVTTIAHEVGHVLGIGGWNTVIGVDILIQGTQLYLSNTKYPKTTQAYIENVRPTSITLPGAPVESEKGLGTGSYAVHWENNPTHGMQRDLMTYKITNISNIISIVDLTYLKEIGRKVDLSQSQSLKTALSSIIGEYIFEEEVSPYSCGACTNCSSD